ncbi:oligosaccharide flippase family protein [Litorivivens sp.]|uniref:oligosaccharide flippase family protein n=1 Tax=Litorivivens sp. TaxID=2020868 RepID=UPI003561DA91
MKTKLQYLLNHPFMRNFSWMAAGELVVRISRLVTTLILARFLTQADYGLAALAIASAELVRILASNGIGNLIVKTTPERLDSICSSVFWANLGVGLIMFALQYFGAGWIGTFYDSPMLTEMLTVLAVTHLIYPFAMVQFNLLQRASRMRETSLLMAMTVGADNLISAALVIAGFGVWGVVYAKIAAAVLWVVGLNLRKTWLPALHFSREDLRTMRDYSRHVMFSEVLKNGRNQIDLLILGRVLGAEAFGLYAFARNAGLGISLSITNGFNMALFPRLCDAMREGKDVVATYAESLKMGMSFIAPALLVQALTAPFYVPIVFGEQWREASWLVTLLCLSALPRMLFEATSVYYRASDRIAAESRLALVFTLGFSLMIALTAQWGANTVALAMIAAYSAASTGAMIEIWTARNRQLALA